VDLNPYIEVKKHFCCNCNQEIVKGCVSYVRQDRTGLYNKHICDKCKQGGF
jgi:RNase P subunit RPR2